MKKTYRIIIKLFVLIVLFTSLSSAENTFGIRASLSPLISSGNYFLDINNNWCYYEERITVGIGGKFYIDNIIDFCYNIKAIFSPDDEGLFFSGVKNSIFLTLENDFLIPKIEFFIPNKAINTTEYAWYISSEPWVKFSVDVNIDIFRW